jgi:hypothetical protein
MTDCLEMLLHSFAMKTLKKKVIILKGNAKFSPCLIKCHEDVWGVEVQFHTYSLPSGLVTEAQTVSWTLHNQLHMAVNQYKVWSFTVTAYNEVFLQSVMYVWVMIQCLETFSASIIRVDLCPWLVLFYKYANRMRFTPSQSWNPAMNSLTE